MMHLLSPWGWGYWPGLIRRGGSMGILLLVAVGLIVYLVVRNETKKRDADTRETDTPLEIAKRRYARGEITKKEFEQLKKDLG